MFKLIPSLNANRKAYNTITIDNLINKIKTPDNAIIAARKAGKYINRPEYDFIKVNQIEAYYPNSFNGKSTGYIYLDIDGFNSIQETIEYKESLKSNDLVYACWLSLSEHGLSILVKSDSLNKDNYNSIWNYLNTEHFNNRLDHHAKGYDKVNCLSFDSDIYVNHNSLLIEENKKFSTSLLMQKYNKEVLNFSKKEVNEDLEEGTNKGVLNFLQINYRTVFEDSLFENINTPLIYKEGIKVLDIDTRFLSKFKIQVGRRTRVLGALSMQLIHLNPLPEFYNETVLMKQLINSLLYINKNCSVEPLPRTEVINIFNANYEKYKEKGLDISKYEIERFIIWHKECQLSQADKTSIGNKLLANAKGKGKEYNQSIINDAIETLQDGSKLSIKRISEYTQLNESTVKRYWKPFKSIIKEYNENLNNNMEEQVKVNDNGFDITTLPTTIIEEPARPIISDLRIVNIDPYDKVSLSESIATKERKVVINDNGIDITTMSSIVSNYRQKNI